MAEESTDGQEKTEDPSEDRQSTYREKGEIAVSRDLTSNMSLLMVILLLGFMSLQSFEIIFKMTQISFESILDTRISTSNFLSIMKYYWISFLKSSLPYLAASAIIALVVTFAQTQFNISAKRVSPQWNRLDPISGIKRLFSMNVYFELFKSITKMFVISGITGVLIYSSINDLPGLMFQPLGEIWTFWALRSKDLFISVIFLMLLISAVDYIFNFTQLQNKMKMTKQEVKEEAKQREVDPHTRGRIRRIQRDISGRKTMEATKDATVLITNPTHYSIALFYEFGMPAPIVVAKGKDELALQMRKVAKEHDIPIVENKPVARNLYSTTDISQEIPSDLYKAISEIILYVFKLKNKIPS